MKKLIALTLIFLMSPLFAQQSPPYTVEINVIAASSGGQTDSYEAFLDGNSIGAVDLGVNTFDALLPSDGTYTFRVDATGPGGVTASDPVVFAVIEPPGKVTITVQIP